MKNVRLVSHNDLDGVGPGILAKIAFGDKVKVAYCSYNNIDKTVGNFL